MPNSLINDKSDPIPIFYKKKFTIRTDFDQHKIKPLELCCIFCNGVSNFSIWHCVTLTIREPTFQNSKCCPFLLILLQSRTQMHNSTD